MYTNHYPPGQHPDLPPPISTRGMVGWFRTNLFANIGDTLLTIFFVWFLYQIIPPLFEWFFIDSVWIADSRADCWDQMEKPEDAACWAFIKDRLGIFVYGFYPAAERWRVNVSFVLLVILMVGVLGNMMPGKMEKWLVCVCLFPFISAWLLVGGMGLIHVDTDQFGGVMLTIIIGVTGIVGSLPIGVVLALGRRSKMPIIKSICIIFIEFFRGIPLIALLFVASTMLNYFLPPGTTFDLLLRVLIIVILFSSAYIAEVVRGGLQGIPVGQYEAASSIGLNYWNAHRLIILPQALRISIPGIVNTFIGLFKDTTLVIIIGLMDPLGIGRASLADPDWVGLAREVYIFVGIFFFICCFSMSRYSLNLEKKLEN